MSPLAWYLLGVVTGGIAVVGAVVALARRAALNIIKRGLVAENRLDECTVQNLLSDDVEGS